MNLYVALYFIIQVVAFGHISVNINILTDLVFTRLHISDVNPLTVEVSAIQISTVDRNPLLASGTPEFTASSSHAEAVLETEACLVSVGHLVALLVKDVVMDEGLKGVVVLVTGMPLPLVWLPVGQKVCCAIVHC